MMNISQGSLEECKYYALLAEDLSFGKATVVKEIANETSRLLSAYTGAIKNNINS
jgi:hypothetical protein